MIKDLIEISKLAGVEILKIYAKDDFGIEIKADETPVTLADKAANDLIVKELQSRFPDIPILAEESALIPYEVRSQWKECFIVDPIDGTKEFIKRNGEFSVNIAYYRDQKVQQGVIYAPALDLLYYTQDGQAFRQRKGKIEQLPTQQTDAFTVVVSHSHFNPATQAHLDELKRQRGEYRLIRMGSSLKMCLIAEGSADYYPRLGATSEWDTAAAQAILEASGCELIEWESGKPLIYNKESVLNPNFRVGR